MTTHPLSHRADRRRRPRHQRLGGARARGGRPQGRPRGAQHRQAGAARRRDRRRTLRRRCRRPGGGRAAVRGGRRAARRARCRALQRQRPGARARSPRSIPEAVRKAIEISAFGGFLVVQQAARRMIPHGSGAILLTGASASVKGYPHSAAFAMGKFALRGLAQSTARELGPEGHPRRAFRHRRRRAQRAPARPGGPPRQHARSGRDRPDLSRSPAPAAQRLVARGRAAALGRDLLTALPRTRTRHRRVRHGRRERRENCRNRIAYCALIDRRRGAAKMHSVNSLLGGWTLAVRVAGFPAPEPREISNLSLCPE